MAALVLSRNARPRSHAGPEDTCCVAQTFSIAAGFLRRGRYCGFRSAAGYLEWGSGLGLQGHEGSAILSALMP